MVYLHAVLLFFTSYFDLSMIYIFLVTRARNKPLLLMVCLQTNTREKEIRCWIEVYEHNLCVHEYDLEYLRKMQYNLLVIFNKCRGNIVLSYCVS